MSAINLRGDEHLRETTRRLVDYNKTATCKTVNCYEISCPHCPMRPGQYPNTNTNRKMTIGDLRTQLDALDTLDKVPSAGSKLEGVPKDSEGVGANINDVRQPGHYKLFQNIESIEVIARSMTVEQFHGFCFGNILKYRLRAGKKSELATMEKDLAKAAFYETLFEKYRSKCHE